METCAKDLQMRSERELRRVAQHVATLLPEDMGDAKRVCDLAMELQQWADSAPENDPSQGEKVSVLRRK